MTIVDLTRRQKIASHAACAKNLFQRLRGLIGRLPLREGEALWIPHCQGIHTWGMSYPIDVIFLDSRKTVVRTARELRVNSFGPVSWKADSVVELPSGTLQKFQVQPGDRLAFVDEDPWNQPATSSGNAFTSPPPRGK